MALQGIKVVEFAGLAPGPFAGLILADNGASVVRVDRPSPNPTPTADALCRGKRSIAINPKVPSGREALQKLISGADVLIDPYRPGVLERLGLGPEVFLGDGKGKKGLNEGLIYARMAGFPRTGRQKDMAGHDINYLASSGVLSMLPGTSEKPAFPINILADFAGGGLTCATGILLALLARNQTGKGQVVNVDMVSGVRYLSSFPLILKHMAPAASSFAKERGHNLLDGGAPFYGVYNCKGGGWMSVGCLEPQFFKAFLEGFVGALPKDFYGGWKPDLDIQRKEDELGKLRDWMEKGFMTRTRDEWAKLFHGTDACTVPILTPEEAVEREGFHVIPTPHPQIHGKTGPKIPTLNDPLTLIPGTHTEEILREIGLDGDGKKRLVKDGAIFLKERAKL